MGGRFASRFSEGPLKDGVETLVIHTSKKELSKMSVDRPVFIGEETLLDKGAQGDPMAGAGAAERSAKRIVENLIGAEKVCLVSALGGGTGTGAVPVVARLAKVAGAKRVVALAVLPFQFEGSERARKAEDGLARLRETADKVLVFPNDLLCDEGNMRSLEIPHGWADRPGERLVLGNQMRGLSDRFFIAHERLAQATHLAMEMEDPPTKGGEARDLGPMKWMGMGASTVGERGLWESLARASHWSVIPGEPLGAIDQWRVQAILGEERPTQELSGIPQFLGRLLGREVEVGVAQKIIPRLGPRVRLILSGY
jgi:hypothetical protein